MNFSITGFTGSGLIQYSPSTGGANSGAFRGVVRSQSPESRNPYGLNFTQTAPYSDLRDVDITDPNRENPYLYGYKNFAAPYFSGDYTTPSTYLYETCHGIRKDGSTLRNFYPAYYRYGFFEAPWGTNPTRTTALQNFFLDGLTEKRTLAYSDLNNAKLFSPGLELTTSEYHQLNGINPINCGGGKSPDNCDPRTAAIQHFRYLYYECPGDITAKSSSYQEAELKWLPGNGLSYATSGNTGFLVGGGLYNNAPIPTIFETHGDYQQGDTCSGPNEKNLYSLNTCPAMTLEGKVSPLRGGNDLLAGYVANAIAGFGGLGLGGNGKGGYTSAIGEGAQDLGNEDWWYWYFVFKENAETFPFNNNPDPNSSNSSTKNIVNSDGSVTAVTSYKVKGNNQAIQTFVSKIAQESWYWEHRLCADFPKFLPWTYGGTIFAHPETYFEVPYYSAIGKFGFYGMRFLNTLGTMVDETGAFSSGCDSTNNPFENSNSATHSDEIYDRLIKTASLQRKYNDFFAGNKGLFLALNYNFLTGDRLYSGLDSTTKSGILKLHDKYWIDCHYKERVENTSYPYLLSAWIYDIPRLREDGKYIDILETGYGRTGVPDSYLYSNRLYEQVFSNENLLSVNDKAFLDKYGKYIALGTSGAFNTGSYSYMYKAQKATLEKRSVGHEINGLPVDLFPLNRIYYSTDNSSNYLTGTYSTSKLNVKSLQQVPRNYFQGYYSPNSGNFLALGNLNTFDAFGSPYGFNAGFYHSREFKMSPQRSFSRIKSGELLHNIVTSGVMAVSGLYLLGYNEIGKLDGNFSCFTPIFVQQPTDVICKIGQTPTFRALAVDYHTIPEDKIEGARWPEINYWTKKLKLVDLDDKLLYPISYKWGRFPIAEASNYNLGQLSGVTWADRTGDWCGLESDGSPEFTLIHPKECRPSLTGYSASTTAGMPKDFAPFVQGCKTGIDDQYQYFCMVSGRFGIRRSEPVNLIIDDTLSLDISFKNASPQFFNPVLVFHSFDGQNVYTPIVLSTDATPEFFGFDSNKNAIPELAMGERRTASAVGCLPSWQPCCDENKIRTMGMIGYGAWNYTWQPASIQDLPLLSSNWGQVIPYGGLVSFFTRLTQAQGDALYGRVHLPKSQTGNFIGEYAGVPFDLYLNQSIKVKHWAVEESAWATDNTKEGIPFGDGTIVSALYPPSEGAYKYNSYPYRTSAQSYGKGHWQFSNNLGLIKRLGYEDVVGKTSSWDGKDQRGQTLLSYSWTIKDKDKLFSNIKSSLRNYPGGLNAGWRKSSLGRHMAYFVEGFDAFYILCGNKKKEFVKNLSFVAPGLRVGNAGFQYAWVGQPNSSYLSRQTMPGPYAFFWKLNKHNRDKNGNGMPLGMYAYSTDGPYTMMYDLPAVYGLYLKSNRQDDNQEKIDKLKELRKLAVSGDASYIKKGATVWKQKFEFNSTETFDGATHWCGSPFGGNGNSCKDVYPMPGTDANYCLYPSYATSVASKPDLDVYECPTQGIKNNTCFPPCLSLRYDQGILPGGKQLDMFGKNSQFQPEKIVSQANYDGTNRILGPAWTPWSQYLNEFLPNRLKSSLKKYQSIDPCNGGGSDHCNYVTPTVWLGSAQKGYSNINYMNSLIRRFS